MKKARFDPIPASIWSASVLQLPPRLVTDYQKELEDLGLYDDACGPSPSNLTGGTAEKDTHDHFKCRFGASCVRTEYLMLDPRGVLTPVSTDILSCFSEGRVAVLDVPCGSGPGILGFLGLAAELRIHGCLPRQPLEIVITGGDISETARQLYDNMLQKAKPWLANEGIRISWNIYTWDASEQTSTAKLVDNWFQQSSNFEEHIVLAAAFSGEAANNFDLYKPSFSHIASRLYDKCATIIWLEPKWNKGEKLLTKLIGMFQSAFSRCFRTEPQLKDTFKWQHPFKENQLKGTLLVLKHSRMEVHK